MKTPTTQGSESPQHACLSRLLQRSTTMVNHSLYNFVSMDYSRLYRSFIVIKNNKIATSKTHF